MLPTDPRTVRRHAQREEVTRELLRLLNEIDTREQALREHNREERERLRELRALVAERRALLDGRPGQLPLTGSES
jgi:hypothetical protein